MAGNSGIVRPAAGATRERQPSLPTHYVRDMSGGVNLSTGRESIQDNEVWWMEGLMPQAPGNLAVLPGTRAWTGGPGTEFGAPGLETGAPSYAMSFSVGSTPYVLVIWKNTGNAYLWQYGIAFTKIAAGLFTSGQTAACGWNAQGVLIVDPVAGYYDWNVSVANTVTALSNSVQELTITDPGSGYVTAPTLSFGGPGTGAVAQCFIGANSATLTNGGGGYAVNDVLKIPYAVGGGGEDLTINVAAVDNVGKITAFSIATRGKGVTSSGTVTGGTGSGAAFTINFGITATVVTTRGTGYSAAPVVTVSGGGPTRAGSISAAVSGSLVGSSIAAYAGRAWIASGRTVTFTDVDSYASFVGSGSTFTIQDWYLIRTITALYAANNYLYIFGDTSIDVLSNVTVADDGTANFSRVNVNASVGCNQPLSIFPYSRSVMFANGAGFWRLSGATPECISEGRIDLLIQSITFSSSTPISGAPVTINGVLCAAFLFTFTDNFVLGGTSHMIALYANGRWFFSRPTVDGANPLPLAIMFSIPSPEVDRSFLLYAFGTDPAFLYEAFDQTQPTGRYWRVMTKIYDLGKPLLSKHVTRAGAGVTLSTTSLGNFGIAIDTEYGAALTNISPLNGTGFPYRMMIGSQDVPDNAKYLGFTASGSGVSTDISRLDWLAFEYETTNEWQ